MTSLFSTGKAQNMEQFQANGAWSIVPTRALDLEIVFAS